MGLDGNIAVECGASTCTARECSMVVNVTGVDRPVHGCSRLHLGGIKKERMAVFAQRYNSHIFIVNSSLVLSLEGSILKT